MAEWNKRDRSGNCIPAKCWADASCYCTDRFDGWDSGGSYADYGTCRKVLGQVDCLCNDCGQAWLKCQDHRCNDVNGYLLQANDQGRLLDYWGCLDDPYDGFRGSRNHEISKTFYSYCYTKTVPCDLNRCQYGEGLMGCQRISEGSCVSCGGLKPGHYWLKRGKCDQPACHVAYPGYYMTKLCSNISNSEVYPCIEHSGNPKAVAFPNPIPQYYCPGGTTQPIHVPAFATVNANYSDFVCQDGYFKVASECRACLPGFACKHSKSYACKAGYYTDRYAQSVCKRCTARCTYASEVPMRCQEGSNMNSRCVSCGLCGDYPSTGVNCVLDQAAFLKLPETCTPSNVSTSDEMMCSEG